MRNSSVDKVQQWMLPNVTQMLKGISPKKTREEIAHKARATAERVELMMAEDKEAAQERAKGKWL